jgi:DNA-binding cell septation regulator SpoVG
MATKGFTVTRFYKAEKDGNWMGVGNVQVHDLGLEFRDLRLFEGSNGRFVAFPSKSYEKDGKTQYMPLVAAIRDDDNNFDETGQATIDGILEALVDAWENAEDRPAARSGGGGSSRSQGRSSARRPSSSGSSRRSESSKPSGRGPVKTSTGTRKLNFD